MSKAILVTGADGYLGMRVTRKLLASDDAPLMLWVRSADENEFRAKVSIMKDALATPDSRVSFYTGDLSADNCFSSVQGRDVARIIHCAAVTRFNVDAQTAQSVNIDGTRRLLELAAQCPDLECLCYVSSIYASGMQQGTIEEEPIGEEAGFANHYERSKWAAERALIDSGGAIPWSIVRVATVLADDESGHATQQNAVHNTLKLLFYGLMSVVPGLSSTPLYLITGDFATEALVAAVSRGDRQKIYHACYSKDECLTLGEFVDLTHETFERDASFQRRRVLKPLYTDLDAFNLLSDASTGFGDGIMKQALSSVSPFARQLYIEKEVANEQVRHLLGDAYSAPDAAKFVRKTCEFLVASKWGRAPEVAVN
ncbi:MAG TPA: SDR family oxidoreductase [Planktothrix sp.]|jgi:thioester reductase-like protein